MKTTTTIDDHPSTADQKKTEPQPEHDPIHVLEESKLVLEEWTTTVVPKIMPRVQTLWEHVTDLKIQEQNHQDNVKHEQSKRATDAELGIIFDQTIVMEQQVQALFNRLLSCNGNIHDVLEGNPLRTKHAGAISLHIFGRVGHKTQHQVTLDHYYQQVFLPQYETATIEYQKVIDQCQHILLLVSNARTCMKSSTVNSPILLH
jgi:hypothetical protein